MSSMDAMGNSEFGRFLVTLHSLEQFVTAKYVPVSVWLSGATVDLTFVDGQVLQLPEHISLTGMQDAFSVAMNSTALSSNRQRLAEKDARVTAWIELHYYLGQYEFLLREFADNLFFSHLELEGDVVLIGVTDGKLRGSESIHISRVLGDMAGVPESLATHFSSRSAPMTFSHAS